MIRPQALAAVLCAAFGAAAWPMPADGQSQPAPAADPATAAAAPAWLVNCTNTGPQGALQCSMSQSVVLTASGQRILTATIRNAEAAQGPTLLLTLPHGLYLPAGVRMSVDETARPPLQVQTCDATGCYALHVIEPELLEALRGGEAFKIVIEDQQRREITLSLRLDGFGTAFDNLR